MILELFPVCETPLTLQTSETALAGVNPHMVIKA